MALAWIRYREEILLEFLRLFSILTNAKPNPVIQRRVRNMLSGRNPADSIVAHWDRRPQEMMPALGRLQRVDQVWR
jgi:hypothetical protein